MIAAYVALFVVAGAGFLFFNLLVGHFLRPRSPNRDKLEIYECGEPTIGSSFVQFDLRFYVVALLFVVFDVEVALLFPWAVVYGKAVHLMDPRVAISTPEAPAGAEAPAASESAMSGPLSPDAAAIFAEMGVPRPQSQAIDGRPAENAVAENHVQSRSTGDQVYSLGRSIAGMALIDGAIFFAVLAVGFAYVWSRGDLDWVRASSPSSLQSADAELPNPRPTDERSLLV